MNEINTIRQLMDEKNWRTLKKELTNFEPFQVAECLETLPKVQQLLLFRILPRELAKEVFIHLSVDDQTDIVENIAGNMSVLSKLLNDLEPDDRTAFFEELPGEVTQRLLQLLSTKEREIAIKLLGYPTDSIGRLMTPEYVAIKSHFTVQQTLEHIRKYGHNSETIDVIYIVDNRWKLIDDIRIRDIILASPEQHIAEISDGRFIALHAYDDKEMAVKAFQDNDRSVLPVTDSENTLLGIVTVDDVMDVMEEETTEDIEKMGALAPSDDPYLETGILELAKNRIVWLVVLMLTATLTGIIISSFEEGLMALPVLMAFVPMLMNSGGTAGVQSSTLVIRGMAVGEIYIKDVVTVLWKELRVAVLCGLAMGIINSIRIYIMHGQDFWLSITVSLALITTIIMAKTIGCVLPLIAKQLRIDPAIMAAPVITTIVDALSLIFYFSIAKMILGV
jgi:magnesium transporter